jgi:glycosyltransferase involved in cell wall biosynthesis
MKIAVISRSDSVGGADKAAFQLHKYFLQSGFSSEFLTGLKTLDHAATLQVGLDYQNIVAKIRNGISRSCDLINTDNNLNFHSYNFFPTKIHKVINEKYDFANLHWLGSNFMSIKDISKIKIPILWTMHDLWPILGAEHHRSLSSKLDTTDIPYLSSPINNFLFNYKKESFSKLNIKFIAPSDWIKSEIEKSFYGSIFSTVKIPNPIDINTFCPKDKLAARLELGLPLDKFLILVGAFDFTGRNKLLKGHHHYLKVKEQLLSANKDCIFIEIGVKDIKKVEITENTISYPFIKNSRDLATIYQAVDIAFIPSLIENLSQIGAEAQSSGIPVIAFDVGGNKEICSPNRSGFIIEPFNISEAVRQILVIKANEKFKFSMGKAARAYALENWSPTLIVRKYFEVLQSVNPLNRS